MKGKQLLLRLLNIERKTWLAHTWPHRGVYAAVHVHRALSAKSGPRVRSRSRSSPS